MGEFLYHLTKKSRHVDCQVKVETKNELLRYVEVLVERIESKHKVETDMRGARLSFR
jgi:hypothetical protein